MHTSLAIFSGFFATVEFSVLVGGANGLVLPVAGTLFAASLILCIISIRALILAALFVQDPLSEIRRRLTLTPAPLVLAEAVESIAHNEDLMVPDTFVVRGSQLVASFCLRQDRAAILFSQDALSALDSEEIDAVLRHEFCHIQKDTEMQNELIFTELMNEWPAHFPLLFVALYAPVIMLIIAAHPFLAMSTQKIGILYAVGERTGAVVTLLVFVIAFIGLAVTMQRQLRIPYLGKGVYFRELLADAYSVLKTGEVRSLRSALAKLSAMLVQGPAQPESFATIALVISRDARFSHDLQDLNLVLDARRLRTSFKDTLLATPSGYVQRYCPISHRFANLDLLDRIMHARILLSHNMLDIKILRKDTSELPWSITETLRRCEPKSERFFEFIKANTSGFNLYECAETIAMRPFDVFVMLLAAISSGHIRLALT
jgi:hypothetical protein